LKGITRKLLIYLTAVVVTVSIIITGCTPDPVTITITETLPKNTITTTLTETTTLVPTTTVPDQIARDVTVDEAQVMILDNADNPEFVILDVRSPAEYAAGHIVGSALIDFRGDTFQATVEALDRDYTYLIY